MPRWSPEDCNDNSGCRARGELNWAEPDWVLALVAEAHWPPEIRSPDFQKRNLRARW